MLPSATFALLLSRGQQNAVSDARSFAMVLVGAVAGWTLRMASVRYIEALFSR
jgi:hypothetical protein